LRFLTIHELGLCVKNINAVFNDLQAAALQDFFLAAFTLPYPLQVVSISVLQTRAVHPGKMRDDRFPIKAKVCSHPTNNDAENTQKCTDLYAKVHKIFRGRPFTGEGVSASALRTFAIHPEPSALFVVRSHLPPTRIDDLMPLLQL